MRLASANTALGADRVDALMKKSEHARIMVGLPKFRLDCEADLVKSLEYMGIHQAFTDADFSPLFQNKPASGLPTNISDSRHQALINVDEKGTEAAAASTSSVKAATRENYFYADHPFIFQIVDTKTSAILVMGRVSDPTK